MIDDLAQEYHQAPTPTRCAALADALVKRSDFAAARQLLAEGSGRFPAFTPLELVRARLAVATGDRVAVRTALAAALMLDAGHPMVVEMVHAHCPELLGDSEVPDGTLAFTSPGEVTELPSDQVAAGAALVSESLADLYRRQGHLDEARRAYAELLARDPDNASLTARYQAVQQELAATRPLPYDARESGGTAVGPWLAGLAAREPASSRAAATSYDAFFEAPPAPPSATTDFDAFERWLKDLAR